MTNSERYTVIERIYANGGIFNIDVTTGPVLTSEGIVIDDDVQLFLIVVAVAAGINDVDTNLLSKMSAKFASLTAVLPASVSIDVKGCNSNTNPAVADAGIFYLSPQIYDNGVDPPQTYNFNVLVVDFLNNHTGITRLTSGHELFPYFEEYRANLQLEVLENVIPINYIIYHEDTNEYLIVEIL